MQQDNLNLKFVGIIENTLKLINVCGRDKGQWRKWKEFKGVAIKTYRNKFPTNLTNRV